MNVHLLFAIGVAAMSLLTLCELFRRPRRHEPVSSYAFTWDRDSAPLLMFAGEDLQRGDLVTLRSDGRVVRANLPRPMPTGIPSGAHGLGRPSSLKT